MSEDVFMHGKRRWRHVRSREEQAAIKSLLAYRDGQRELRRRRMARKRRRGWA